MQVVREYKLRCLFLLLALAFLAGLVALGTSTGSDASKPRRVLSPRIPDLTRKTYELLAGLPQHGAELGKPTAPVTVQFFGDLQCKESRQVMLGALPILIRRWVRPGKVRIVYRSTETDTKGAGGRVEFWDQQGAALAAGQQDKLWNFIDVFYREQGPEFTGYVNERFLHLIAEQAGLDLPRWQGAREPVWRWRHSIEIDESLAGATGVDSTPSFLIGPTGGHLHALRHFALEEAGVFEEAIRAGLRKA
jgi:protein-disulfide isomerase